MMKSREILVTLLFFCPLAYGQPSPQNIEKEIDNFAANLDVRPDLAFYYINSAYRKSMAIKNDSLTSRALCNLGYYYYLKNDFDGSKKMYGKAIAFAKKIRFQKILSSSYNQLGIMASDANKFDEALKLYLASLKIADAAQLPDMKSRILLNLGNLYMVQKDTVKGLDYYMQNIANAKKYALNKELSQGYITMAIVYAASDKKKTLRLYNKALSIAQKSKDLSTAFVIHIDISNFFLDSPSERDIAGIFKHLRAAAEIQKKTRDKSMLFFVYFNFGGCYFIQKQYDKALSYYNKALFLSKNAAADQRLNLYKYISQAYSVSNDYKNAYFFQEKFRDLNDSIFNINKNIAFNEIQTKYEVEKKNLKIDLLSKEKTIEKTKKQVVIFLGFAGTIPLLLLTLFYKKKNKLQKVINQKEHELFVQEKTKIENEQEIKRVRAILEGQSTERDRIASEIHDGVGGELAGIKLYLYRINASLEDEKISLVINRLTGLFQELRNISHNLSSNFLKDKDFYSVLLELKKGYEIRNEFNLEIVIYPEDTFTDLPESFTHEVYRIIQELLANVSKHAKAEKVDLTITRHDDFLNIIVEDDGIGFTTSGSSGIGLKNIQDRLKPLHGTLNIESIPNEGSIIIIDIPNKP